VLRAQANQPDPLQFVSSVVASLGRADRAIGDINAVANADLLGKMIAIKNAAIEVDIASRTIQPFTTAGAEYIRTSSEAIVNAYRMIGTSLDIQRDLYEKLDTAKSVDDLAGYRKRLSDGGVMIKQSSSLLMDAAVLVAGSAIVPDKADPENHSALVMSASEKTALIKSLKQVVARKLAAGESDSGPMSAAKIMLKVLDKEWRLAR
jgi:hypothetical protein